MSRQGADKREAEAIAVDGVTCRFGQVLALDHLSLRVERGQVVALVGPNGAGKTTLIDVVCGLVRPERGLVTVLGYDSRRAAREIRRRIGVLPQETALYEDLDARQNLRFAADLYGAREPERRIDEALDLVALADREHDPVRTFSGGMQRRLAIARALLHDPELLILDEPTLGVDVEARHQIWQHIRELRRLGRTVLLATNYLDEAEALCDRVAILREGRLVAEDTPAALVARTGRCVDLECTGDAARALEQAVGDLVSVLRTRRAAAGITLYVDGRSDPEEVVRQAMLRTPVHGFKVRSPDLVEVFQALAVGDP